MRINFFLVFGSKHEAKKKSPSRVTIALFPNCREICLLRFWLYVSSRFINHILINKNGWDPDPNLFCSGYGGLSFELQYKSGARNRATIYGLKLSTDITVRKKQRIIMILLEMFWERRCVFTLPAAARFLCNHTSFFWTIVELLILILL